MLLSQISRKHINFQSYASKKKKNNKKMPVGSFNRENFFFFYKFTFRIHNNKIIQYYVSSFLWSLITRYIPESLTVKSCSLNDIFCVCFCVRILCFMPIKKQIKRHVFHYVEAFSANFIQFKDILKLCYEQEEDEISIWVYEMASTLCWACWFNYRRKRFFIMFSTVNYLTEQHCVAALTWLFHEINCFI